MTQTAPDKAPTSNLTKLIPNYVIKFEQPNKNDNSKHNPHTITNATPTQKHNPHTINKHNPHTKLHLLNRHKQTLT